jgi:hypothetical protein
MKITKKFIKNILVALCEQLKYPIPKVEFIPDAVFLEAYLNLPVSKKLIEMGVFEKESTPSFMAMGSKVIYVSLSRANKGLSQFSEYQVSEYLKYALGHELVHINEWVDDPVANELNANEKSITLADPEAYAYVNGVLWKDVLEKINHYTKNKS